MAKNNNYYPISKNPFKLGTVVPFSMKSETDYALRRLLAEIGGDIDRYVSAKLGYKNVNELFKYFAAEQIDALGLAIYNTEKDSAAILGDMTGIGKGRVAAGMIRFACINKYPCVFVTEKSGLFSDIYRDLTDIAYVPTPFIINSDSDARITVEVEEGGEIKQKTAGTYTQFKGVYAPLNDKKFKVLSKDETIKALRNRSSVLSSLPKGYDFVVTTYSQFRADNIAGYEAAKLTTLPGRSINYKDKTTDQTLTTFIRNYSKGGIIIFDESHNAGGLSIQGLFADEITKKSKGTLFMSATFAKTPANMPIYANKTALADAQLSRESMQSVFERGGVALQEIVASEMVKEIQMLRRQRAYDGVPFYFKSLEESEVSKRHRDTFDKVTAIIRSIIDFQNEDIKKFIKGVNDGLSKSNSTSKVEENRNRKNAGTLEQTGIFNTMHHLTATLLMSLKAFDVAQEAIRHLRDNKKVVIAFSHTCATYLDELGLKANDVIEEDNGKSQSDFSHVLERLLRSVLEVRVIEESGVPKPEEIKVESLPVYAQNRYNDILKTIQATSIGISLSPIDTLINILESTPRHENWYRLKPERTKNNQYRFVKDRSIDVPRTYVVKECTGRTHRIANIEGVPTYVNVRNKKKLFFSQFNNGEADVLLINSSASTGVSCHSSEKFYDVRKRVMILHENELDINQQVQKLGRIFRSGMITTIENEDDNLPEYYYITSSIPAEQRLFMILSKKLKSLDANTTGNQSNSSDTLETTDFFNKYGAAIIKDYLLEDNRALYARLGGDIFPKPKDEEKNKDNEYIKNKKSLADREAEEDGRIDTAPESICWKVTNRMQVMTIADQETFYNEVLKRYKTKIDALKSAGEYDLEVEYFDYQAKTTAKFLFAEGNPNATSSFGNMAVREQCEVKVLRKPKYWWEVKSDMEASLNGLTPEQHIKSLKAEILATFDEYFEKEKQASQERLVEYEKDFKIAKRDFMDYFYTLDYGKNPKPTIDENADDDTNFKSIIKFMVLKFIEKYAVDMVDFDAALKKLKVQLSALDKDSQAYEKVRVEIIDLITPMPFFQQKVHREVSAKLEAVGKDFTIENFSSVLLKVHQKLENDKDWDILDGVVKTMQEDFFPKGKKRDGVSLLGKILASFRNIYNVAEVLTLVQEEIERKKIDLFSKYLQNNDGAEYLIGSPIEVSIYAGDENEEFKNKAIALGLMNGDGFYYSSLGYITDLKFNRPTFLSIKSIMSSIYIRYATLDKFRETYLPLKDFVSTDVGIGKFIQTERLDRLKNWDEVAKKTDAWEYVDIVRGNPILAIAKANNIDKIRPKIIKYSTREGKIRVGVQMNVAKKNEDVLKTSFYPLSSEAKNINTFPKNDSIPIISQKNKKIGTSISITPGYSNLIIKLPKGKPFDSFYEDKEVLGLLRTYNYSGYVAPYFSVQGQLMVGDFPLDNAEKVFKILENLFALEVIKSGDSNLKIIPNDVVYDVEYEIPINTKYVNEYTYLLPKPYKAGEYPTQNFIRVEDDADFSKFGIIIYSVALTETEKAKYSLLPYFESPAAAWKNFQLRTNTEYELEEMVQKYKSSPSVDVDNLLKKLNQFILLNIPESGNPELFLGNFSSMEVASFALENSFKVNSAVKPTREKIEFIKKVLNQISIKLKI